MDATESGSAAGTAAAARTGTGGRAGGQNAGSASSGDSRLRPAAPASMQPAGPAPVPLDEVYALMRYVAERGLDPDGSVLGPLYDAVARLEDAADEAARTAADKDVLLAYSRLAALTFPHGINGATLIDCRHVRRHIALIVIFGCLFFILAIASDVLNLFFGTGSGQAAAGSGGWWHTVGAGVPVVLHNLEPFFWGGLGATVYLTKSLSDHAAAGTYSQWMLHGTGSRIFLGAIIGAIVANLFADPQALPQGTQLTIGAVAFLSGLGVRAIYAGFERLIDSIVNWIQPDGRGAASAGAGTPAEPHSPSGDGGVAAVHGGRPDTGPSREDRSGTGPRGAPAGAV